MVNAAPMGDSGGPDLADKPLLLFFTGASSLVQDPSGLWVNEACCRALAQEVEFFLHLL